MVLVNSHPGPIYPPLAHARWHEGWTFTDLIFPFFIFIVGVAMPYSFARRLASGESGHTIFLHVLKRCLLLFALGLFLNGFPHFDLWTLRIMGILQRIAICYGMAAFLYVYLRLSPKSMLAISGVILIAYFVLMCFVPAPGYGAGVLEPVGNWGNYIDRLVMPGRLQHGDWEGKTLLGNFPALVTMLIGVVAGICLRDETSGYEKLTKLYFYGSASMAAGAIWSLWFPISQSMWTSSLVLLMGGISLLALASCYYLVDVRQSRWWILPCLIYGRNSIAVWVFSQLGMKTMQAMGWWEAGGGVLMHYLGPLNGSLAFAIVYDLFWLGVMAILYRRKIFIKL